MIFENAERFNCSARHVFETGPEVDVREKDGRVVLIRVCALGEDGRAFARR